jgi:GT2 family glycosyltransferase
VAFTDDDCLVPSDWIGQIAGAFERNSGLAAVTGGSLPDPEHAADPRILAATSWHPPEARLFRRKVNPSLVGGCLNFSVRRSWAGKVGMFDPELGPGGRYRGAEDTDFIHRLLQSGATILYDPAVVVFHLGWRNDESQTAVEFEYGHGIAAWALKMAAQGDFFPMGIALEVVASQGRRALGGILRRDRSAARTGRAYLSGLGRGAVAWLLARGNGAERHDSVPKEIPHG